MQPKKRLRFPPPERLEEMQQKPFYALRKGTTNKVVQLAFDFFNSGIPEEDGRHSNSIALFDVMPKYLADVRKVQRSESKDGKFESLPELVRPFEHEGAKYQLVVRPARLKEKDGVYRDYYPGPFERVVEMALRKIAIDKRRTQLIEDWAGCVFTVYELMKELERIGRTVKREEVKKAIEILHLATIELQDESGQIAVSSPILPMRGINEKQPTGEAATYVLFHPMIRAAIERLEYRQHDYLLAARLKNHLAQYVHTRMVHRFTQASLTHKYSIRASAILAGSSSVYARPRKGFEQVREAIEELKANGVIMEYTAEPITGPRGALIDEMYHLIPGRDFVNEQKRANAVRNEHERKFQSAAGAQLEAANEADKRTR